MMSVVRYSYLVVLIVAPVNVLLVQQVIYPKVAIITVPDYVIPFQSNYELELS